MIDIVNGIEWEEKVTFKLILNRDPVYKRLTYDKKSLLEEIDKRCERRWTIDYQSIHCLTISFESKDDALHCSLALL